MLFGMYHFLNLVTACFFYCEYPIKLISRVVQLNGLVRIHWHTGSGKDRRDYSKSVELLTERVFTLHGYEKGEQDVT
jgi:hypothetical protein